MSAAALLLVIPAVAQSPRGQDSGRLGIYQTKLAEIGALGGDLPESKVAELRQTLLLNTADQNDLGVTEWNALRNSILDKLLAQKNRPPGLAKQLVEMYRNRGNDATWRDYCVQHFALFLETRWPDGNVPAGDKDAELIRAALWDAVGESGGSLAGTALLGLERLSRTDQEVARAAVAAKALVYAQGSGYSTATRATAIQVCASMGLKDILPTARSAISAGGETVLRLSAVAAIGQLGNAADAAALEKAGAVTSDLTVRKAAFAAAARLQPASVEEKPSTDRK